MMVRCVQLINGVTGNVVESSTWMTIDSVYTVLAIDVSPGQSPHFRIVGDNPHTPALFDCRMFSVVEGSFPSSWQVYLSPQGHMEIGPLAWLRPGYWDAYFDGDPGAERVFEAERQRMLGG